MVYNASQENGCGYSDALANQICNVAPVLICFLSHILEISNLLAAVIIRDWSRGLTILGTGPVD